MKLNKDRAMKESKNIEMPSFVYRDGMTADKENPGNLPCG